MIRAIRVKVRAALPPLYNLRFALAILLLSWAAGLIAGAVNGIRLEVE